MPEKKTEKPKEDTEEDTLQADLEMEPGRELKANEADLAAGFILKAGDLKTQEDVNEAAKKLLEKKTKKKTKAKKTTPKTRKPKTVTVQYTGLMPMGSQRPPAYVAARRHSEGLPRDRRRAH